MRLQCNLPSSNKSVSALLLDVAQSVELTLLNKEWNGHVFADNKQFCNLLCCVTSQETKIHMLPCLYKNKLAAALAHVT